MSLDDLKALKLLVAVDGSMGSIKAIQKAADLAKEAIVYDLVIIHVMEVRDYPTLISDAVDDDRDARAKAILSDMLDVAKSNGIEARSTLLKGHPVQAVLDYAEEFRPNMIIVGSRGMNAAKSALIGSVASAISRKAKFPVLVVRSDTAGTGPV